MKHKILRLIAVLILGLFVFVKANPTDQLSTKINTFFGREQTTLLSWVTDVPENLPTDVTGSALVPTLDITTPQEANPVACTMDYNPVCADVQVECIRAPCPPIKQTFGNRCTMNANPKATFLYTWECAK